MKHLAHWVRHYPLSTALTVVIWYLCFSGPPHVHVPHVRAIDKWTHAAMYLLFGLTIWWEYLRRHKRVEWRRLLVLGWIAPMLMGGVIELLQAYCTGGRRSGECLDAAANCVGATLALLIGTLVAKCRAR